MIEKTLGKVGNGRSFDLNIPSISGKVDESEPGTKKANRCFLGQRHVAALVGFLSGFSMNGLRSVLAVAIVAMVKHDQNKETSQTHGNQSELSCPMPSVQSKAVELNFQGEFDWSTELQGYVLGAGFLSYLATQVPAGRIADAMGAKHLLVVSNAVSGVLTIISPFAARWNVYALLVVQLLRGLSQGFCTPAIYKVMCNWIPRNERGTLSTIIVCGYSVGISICGIVTGWLCDIPGLGWPSAFYIWGSFSVLLSVLIYFIYYDHPENHPWITDEELKYMTEKLESKISKKLPPTPWKKIFTSVPCYAYIYGLFGHYWATAYFLSVHPSFMGTVLHYPMTENGVSSCLPVLMKSVGGVFASLASYWITKKNLMGISTLRKTATAIGAFGFSLCMVGILLAGCDAIVNIFCFTLSLFLSGIALSGVVIAGVDIAPAFSGSIMGLASTLAGLSNVFLPVITGLVTTHETLSEWRIVFWINLVISGSSGIVYIIFGSAEVQSWNYSENNRNEEMKTKEERRDNKSLHDTIEMKERL